MTDDEQVDLVHSVLRAAVASLAPEQIASGLVLEGSGNFLAELLARVSLATGGSAAEIDQRLVLVSEEILRVARQWIAACTEDEGYL